MTKRTPAGAATLSNDQDLLAAYQGENCAGAFTGALHVTRDSQPIGAQLAR